MKKYNPEDHLCRNFNFSSASTPLYFQVRRIGLPWLKTCQLYDHHFVYAPVFLSFIVELWTTFFCVCEWLLYFKWSKEIPLSLDIFSTIQYSFHQKLTSFGLSTFCLVGVTISVLFFKYFLLPLSCFLWCKKKIENKLSLSFAFPAHHWELHWQANGQHLRATSWEEDDGVHWWPQHATHQWLGGPGTTNWLAHWVSSSGFPLCSEF